MKSKNQNLIYILLKAGEWNKRDILKHFIFTFLYSAMTACFIYLIDNYITGAIIFFVVFFIVGLLKPKETRKPKLGKSKTGKIFGYILYLVLLILLIFLTLTQTISFINKVCAWLILFIMYFIKKVEKKYFNSDNASSHDL